MSVTFSGHLSGALPGPTQPLPASFSAALPSALPGRPVRRVRHEVRDGMAVIAFSAAASSALALALMLFASAVG